MNKIIETELGKEKQCSKCQEFWPLDNEFFPLKKTKSKKDGSTVFAFMAVCKSCYEVHYRKNKSDRKYNIRSKGEKLAA